MSTPHPVAPRMGLSNDEIGQPEGWPKGGVYPGVLSAPGAGYPARLKSALRPLPARCRRRGLPRGLPMTTPLPTPATEPPRYEDALAELERLVQAMEGGQLPLDQLLDSHRRGLELLNLCRDRLQAVENQVQVLEQGQLKDWAPE